MDVFLTFYDQYQNTFNFLLTLLITLAGARFILFIFQAVLSHLTAKTKTKMDDQLIAVIERPFYWGIIIGGFYFALLQVTFLSSYHDMLLIVVKLMAILLLVMLAIGLSNTLLGWVEHRYKTTKKRGAFLITLRKIVNAMIYFMALIFAFQVFGLAVSPLIASFGIGGLAVGLALQPTLSNYFSGLTIVSDGFIEKDDYIQIGDGLSGTVEKIGWRNTVIRLWNNNLVMIPNSKLAESMITNFNEPQSKMDFLVPCGVAYNSRLDKVEKIALKVGRELQKDKRFGVATYKPVVRFYEFGDSNVNFKLILQASNRSAHFEMMHEAIKAMKSAFDEANITIAFPTRTVELVSQP